MFGGCNRQKLLLSVVVNQQVALGHAEIGAVQFQLAASDQDVDSRKRHQVVEGQQH